MENLRNQCPWCSDPDMQRKIVMLGLIGRESLCLMQFSLSSRCDARLQSTALLHCLQSLLLLLGHNLCPRKNILDRPVPIIKKIIISALECKKKSPLFNLRICPVMNITLALISFWNNSNELKFPRRKSSHIENLLANRVFFSRNWSIYLAWRLFIFNIWDQSSEQEIKSV